jgi:nitrate/TMAO reductase-like tetraheme cytochrome c subunit
MRKAVFATMAVFILYGCASKLYAPASVNVQKAQKVDSTITLEQLQASRNLYAATCSSCHNLHLPDEFTAAQWVKILDKMQPKAKITDEQKKMLLAYLTSE